MRLHVGVRGPATPQEAWQRYAAPEQWPRWAPQIVEVEVDEPLIRPGLTGVVRGPLGLRVRFRVDAVDSERRTWEWTVRLAWVRLTLRHDLQEATTGGTHAGLVIDGPAPVVLGYAPLARLALTRLVALPGTS